MPSGKFTKTLAQARAKFHAAPAKMGGGLEKMDLGAAPGILKGKKPVLMLLDGDIIAFHVVTSCLVETFHREKDAYSWEVDMEVVRAGVADRIDGIARWLKAAKVVVAFSGGRGQNFRKQIMRAYKADRTGKKPLAYWPLVEYIKSKWPCEQWPRLEADDVLGVLATLPENVAKYTPVIVSDDKDMLTVPCFHLKLKKPEDVKMQGVFEVKPSQAIFNHFKQTLSGDIGDGYRGLEGVGPKKAEAVLNGMKSPKDGWDRVLKAYEAAGRTVSDALVQARMARILQHTEYCTKKKEIKLWTPPRK